MRNKALRRHAVVRAIVNRPQFPAPMGATYSASDQGLLKGFRKKRRVASPHDQTHAGAFDEPAGMGGAYGA